MTCAGWRPQHIDVSANNSTLFVYSAFIIPSNKVRHASLISSFVCIYVLKAQVFLIRLERNERIMTIKPPSRLTWSFANISTQVGDYPRRVLWTSTGEYKTRFRNYRQLYLAPFWAHIETSRWRLLSNRPLACLYISWRMERQDGKF